VTAADSFLTHWYFHLPNLVLAAATYTLIGRWILALFFRRRADTTIMRVFARVTDPILDAVAVITPRIVPRGLLVVFALVWLTALRMGWFLVLVMMGVRFGVEAS
jgi:hypothetical protein